MDHPRNAAPRPLLPSLCLLAALASPGALRGEVIPVRYAEGVVHGFLAVSDLDRKAVASADLDQIPRGGVITAKMVTRFRDGSLSEETTVFTQKDAFRLVSYRLVQKGPTFETPIDFRVDARRGEVVVRYTDKGGEQKVIERVMELPPDLANGLVGTLVKNLPKDRPETTVSMLAATPKPMLVKLIIRRAGSEAFGVDRKATVFKIKVDIPGLKGFLASILGKEPPDATVLVYESEAPSFLRSEAPMYMGGPLLRMELVGPNWPRPPLVEGGGSNGARRAASGARRREPASAATASR